MMDILDRLKASSKVNGVYPKDIEDAIVEIELLRRSLLIWHTQAEILGDIVDDRNETG